jgi:hypothetical protein
VSTPPHSTSVSAGFCAQRKSLQHELASIVCGKNKLEQTYIGRYACILPLCRSTSTFSMSSTTSSWVQPRILVNIRILSPSSPLATSWGKQSATKRRRIDLRYLPEDTSHQSASPFCLSPTARLAIWWKLCLHRRSPSSRATPAPEG